MKLEQSILVDFKKGSVWGSVLALEFDMKQLLKDALAEMLWI